MQRNRFAQALTPVVFSLFAGLASCSHDVNAHGDPVLVAQAVIPFERAQELALAARPGEVRECELEREHGGLRYSFDIAAGNNLYEVGVDALTGEILENDLDH